ncbi:MAG: hypothetical protein HXM14_02835 [Fusobacterium periodonticum]|jgi:hypothetical protein|nr:hypothetical protein [Fusobacterium periodonticum]
METVITGKTKTGFEYEIDKKILNDYELLEEIDNIGKNPLIIIKLLKRLLKEEQLEKLKEHIRNEEGIVPIDKMEKELIDIFDGINEIKK